MYAKLDLHMEIVWHPPLFPSITRNTKTSQTFVVVELKLDRAEGHEASLLDLAEDLLEEVPGADFKGSVVLVVEIQGEEGNVVVPGLAAEGGSVNLGHNIFEAILRVGNCYVVIYFVVDVPTKHNGAEAWRGIIEQVSSWVRSWFDQKKEEKGKKKKGKEEEERGEEEEKGKKRRKEERKKKKGRKKRKRRNLRAKWSLPKPSLTELKNLDFFMVFPRSTPSMSTPPTMTW